MERQVSGAQPARDEGLLSTLSSSPTTYWSHSAYFTTQREEFVESYLRSMELNKTNLRPEVNNKESILNEIKHFSLASHLFWSLWSFVNAKVSQIPFGYYEYAEERLKRYYELKGEVVGGSREVTNRKEV